MSGKMFVLENMPTRQTRQLGGRGTRRLVQSVCVLGLGMMHMLTFGNS
jgi:hypothetical protein